MQQLKTKIKAPFLLDGISAARRGKVLDYRAERDSHLEQYFYNLHMRQMMSKLKAEKSSQRSLTQSQSKSFDKTIHQQKVNVTQNRSNSPVNLSTTKLADNPPVGIPKSLSKEHFVTFLDSLITTVQNVQQLVISYFPNGEIDDTILQQQKELSKINNATELLTRNLRASSLLTKKEVENGKTQKNFTKLPQLNKKEVTYAKSNTQRERGQSTQYRKTPGKKLVGPQKTLPKNIQNQQEYENPGFEPYESVLEQQTKGSYHENLLQINLPSVIDTANIKPYQHKSGQTTQLPSVRSTQAQQQQLQPLKKYHREVQLVLTKPKQQHHFSVSNQSPDQFKSKSVGNKDILPKQQSKYIPKFDIKKVQSVGQAANDQKKQNTQIQKNTDNKLQQNASFSIKINNVDSEQQQSDFKSEKSKEQTTRIPAVEIVEEVVQNFSNESGIFATQIISDQEIIKQSDQGKKQLEGRKQLEGTACFKIQEVEEKRESIGRMSESSEFVKLDRTYADPEPESHEGFFKMIKTQADQNDLIMLRKQETAKNSVGNNTVENQNSENLTNFIIKVVESIEPKSEDDVVNPLEDDPLDVQENKAVDDQFLTLEPKSQNNKVTASEEPYQQEIFEQED